MRNVQKLISGLMCGLMSGAYLSMASVMAGAAGLAAPAEGQIVRMAASDDAIPGGPGASRTISTASMEKYGTVLGFDAAQREAAKTFHDEYLQRVQEAEKTAADARKQMREMMEDGDREGGMKKMGEIFSKTAKAKAEASIQLMGNLKELMSAEQAPRWEKLERLRRREGVGGGGMGFMAPGAAVDLVDVLGSIKAPETELAKAATPVEEYERDFDRAILNYTEFQKKQAEELRKEQSGGQAGNGELEVRSIDHAAMQARFEEEQKEAGKLRELNRVFAGRIGATLSDEYKTKFEKEWLKRAYKRIFGEPHTLKQLNTVMGFGDLTPEQKTRASEMLDAYAKELDAANAKWLAEQQKAEADGKISPFPFMDEGTPEDLKKAKKNRQELDTKYSKALREMLTEEQRSRLPKRENRGLVGPDGGEMIIDDMGEGGVSIQVMTVDGH